MSEQNRVPPLTPDSSSSDSSEQPASAQPHGSSPRQGVGAADSGAPSSTEWAGGQSGYGASSFPAQTDPYAAQANPPQPGATPANYGQPGSTGQGGYGDPGPHGGAGYREQAYPLPGYGQGGYGQTADHQGTYGQPTYGQPTIGQPTYGRPTFGQPASGQPAYGPPVYGQPVYGPPVYGRPGYGQPGYGYGQSTYGYGQSGYGQALAPGADLAPWGRRVGAYLIDFLPNLIGYAIFMAGYVPFISSTLNSQTSGAGAPVTTGVGPMAIGLLVMLAALGWQIYNRWVVAGRTGQSWGKRVTKISLVSEATGQPIGSLNAFLRDLVHILDGFAYVGFLWPLWDEKRQTFSDKIMKTVVVNEASPRDRWPSG